MTSVLKIHHLIRVELTLYNRSPRMLTESHHQDKMKKLLQVQEPRARLAVNIFVGLR